MDKNVLHLLRYLKFPTDCTVYFEIKNSWKVHGFLFYLSAAESVPSWMFGTSMYSDRREGKGRHCCLGDVLECRPIHLAARMSRTKVFCVRSSFIHFFKSSWFYISSAAWNLINSPPPPTISDDLCHLFCLILLLWYLVYLVEPYKRPAELSDIRWMPLALLASL